ncbi:MAG TPA: DUF5818 domain-containing protein [Terriglobales bacterium]|jgi:hypothetical protein
MKRYSVLIIATMALTGLACGQEGPSANQLFSSDLIAWSGMQQPQAPEQAGQQTAPTPSAQTSSSTADHQQQQSDSNSTDSQDTDSQNQAPAASSFTGTITKEADGFVLKVSETTSYKLDAQRQVEQYEGQRVRVTGTLESGMNLIHVDRIEPLS